MDDGKSQEIIPFLETQLASTASNFSKEQLIQSVSKLVKPLLERDLEKLLSILYRIDVSEEKFKEILAHSPPEQVHVEVARLIVERQIQKIELRKRFSP